LSAFRDRPEARGQNDEFDPKQTQAVLKSGFLSIGPDRAAYTNMDRYKRPLQIVHPTKGGQSGSRIYSELQPLLPADPQVLSE
jgi:hypothetical protein